MTISDFARQACENDEWPEPVPFDQFSSLPDFPIDALSGIGRDMVEAVSEVNQVDPALPASMYLGVLSACLAKKAKVDLTSHHEPANLYACPILDSGGRKSSSTSDMARPVYEYEKSRRDEMSTTIQDAYSAYKIKEKRLEKLQKKAADEDDPRKRERLEKEARELARNLSKNPVPTLPTYLVDNVTPEKLGVLTADNGERMAMISPEGGFFEILGGRYSKEAVGDIDLVLKAHAGDPWSNHRIGREEKRMESPALTLCLAVQPGVIEEIGKNARFREKGLLARFLYSVCKSQVGYRKRQTTSIPVSLRQSYRSLVFSLMDIPFTDATLRLSQDAQAAWDGFYNDIEREMKPEGSLYYLQDWGSKLPGAVARIAGLLRLAEHGAKGLSLPISVTSVTASCMIGEYFRQHAIAVFGMMQEDKRIRLAKQILDYIQRARPETFKGRDVIHSTAIKLMEDVDLGLKVLLDRGYVRAEGTVKVDGPAKPGRPEAASYRIHPCLLKGKNV